MPLRMRVAAAFSVCVLAAGAMYWNALHNPFVYDDYRTVVDNRSITNLSNARSILMYDITRPLVNLSFAVDRAIWGRTPFGFHVTNVLLHMSVVALLFRLAYTLAEEGERVTTAFVAASLLAVHPMMTEAVGYISGRSDVLCTCFFLAALLSGHRWLAGAGRAWGVLTFVLWLAALAAKELIAMFPFVFALGDWLMEPEPNARRRRLMTIHLPWMAAAVAIGLLRVIIFRIEYGHEVQVRWSYAVVELHVVQRYVAMLINPRGQSAFHEVPALATLFDSRVLMAALVIGVVIAVAVVLRRRRPVIAFGFGWFLLVLVPSIVLVMLGRGEPMTEHRVYLASCGLFLAIGDMGAWLGSWLEDASTWLRFAAPTALAVVLAALASETVVRNAIWSDPIALWREAVDLAPRHYYPRLLLGEALADNGRRTDAIEQFRIAIGLRPSEVTGHLKLGRALAETGRIEDAKSQFREALALDPTNQMARQSLAVLEGLAPTNR